ncbi:twin-arginine translocase TatA/TatE family subunit [Sulfuricurvum sp.]|uniref:twin-arginine translocase TatA/TatE family subunit n=1 Tax=Sulfuricurvum sp. TaxID=2025608 RepID=UPI002E35A579|nr:twin-arginine translocase TatA/TatE family subunit [Sulfuricurvum sp.]HEX5330483.1 twin-arginine translocase TatA/TatE family subunit [Sulfuricurvum sp.]
MGGFTSGSHWLIVLAIVVLLFGAKKIPELAKGFGQGIRNFKKEMKEEDTVATTPSAPEAPKQVDTTASTVEAPKTTTQA